MEIRTNGGKYLQAKNVLLHHWRQKERKKKKLTDRIKWGKEYVGQKIRFSPIKVLIDN